MGLSNALGVLVNIAPTIATALGTSILGGAVAALESVFGLTPSKSTSMEDRQDALAAAISGATPEQLAAVRKADQDYAARMAEAGFKDKKALAALAVQEQTLYVQDTANAREANARNEKVFWLGVVILATSAVVMFASMYGAYALLTGHVVVENAALVGMVAGFVGTVIGYVSANAQQVVGFFYGSSKGSETKTDAMAAAFTQTFSPTPDRPGSPTPGGNTT